MQTVIVPICKNMIGDRSDAGNYKQACFSCNYHLQVVWALHLSCISPLWLATTDNQFGFKPKLGTNMCIFY